MQRRTWTLVGAALLAMGIGLVALGQVTEGASVRFVEDVLDQPVAHARGTFTLLGKPQPAEIPVTGAAGTRMVPNPSFGNETTHVTAWSEAGIAYHAVHTVRIEALPDGGAAWTHVNETWQQGASAPSSTTSSTGTLPRGQYFPIEAFDDGDGVQPRVWAMYAGPQPQPLQPKPSQFTGRFLTSFPDGPTLPDGLLVWQVDAIVAQCSSKFLPPEEQARTGA